MIYRFPAKRRAPDAASGDPFACALLDQLPRLRRYAIALVGDPGFAEDLLQDCAERALRRRAGLADLQSLYPWLRTILNNLHIDELRRRRSRGDHLDLDAMTDILALSVPPADRGAAIDFARAMAGLSVDHRRILLLIGLEGLSYHEAAAELGVPVGTVMSRLARAREQLRARLDQDTRQDTRQDTQLRPGGVTSHAVQRAAE
jgi:RNA polymerase sigma-70 factor (ECF subfamily)